MKEAKTVALRLLTLFCLASVPLGLSAQTNDLTTQVSQVVGDTGTNYCDGVDILHIKGQFRFDVQNEIVFGRVNYKATPKVWTNYVSLDANGPYYFDSITVDGKKADFLHAAGKFKIFLRTTYGPKDTFNVFISYSTHPENSDSTLQAIESDRGLYFIDPTATDASRPTQVWTQGEPQSTSRWLPVHELTCPDKSSTEFHITVNDKFKTLSNGVLVSSKKNINGTRTDYWKMDKPHAPYLFMMAIGEYAVVKDKWRGIAVEYYVEPKYKKYARDIYPRTPEMLEFFSEKLDYDYPWQKYSQIIVRDYVSGAMENTTAVVFGEFMQKSENELIESGSNNERIVAHEMFHHWFGDLLTMNGWTNLTLNEGFATLGEFLWWENTDPHLGDVMRKNSRQNLFNTNDKAPRAIAGFELPKSLDKIFNAQTYDGGGLKLWELKDLLGDDLFFAGLRNYLAKGEYSFVSLKDLQVSMEEASSLDLSGFFAQAFETAGHPKLDVSWQTKGDSTTIVFHQRQVEKGLPLFSLYIPVVFYLQNGNIQTFLYTEDTTKVFKLQVGQDEFGKIIFDPNMANVVEYSFQSYQPRDYEKILSDSRVPFIWRYNSADSLIKYQAQVENFDSICLALAQSTDDWRFNFRGLRYLPLDSTTETLFIQSATKHKNFLSRAVSLAKLKGEKYEKVHLQAWEKDKAPSVRATGLNLYSQYKPESAFLLAKDEWQKIKKGRRMHEGGTTAIVAGLLSKGKLDVQPYFWNAATEGNSTVRRELFAPLQAWLDQLEPTDKINLLPIFQGLTDFSKLK